MPYRLSVLMGIYLRDVIPFRCMMDPSTLSWPYIFGDEKPWSTEKLTDIIKRQTQRHMGVSITNRDFRQIIVAIDRRHVRPGQTHDDEDDDDDDEGEFNHPHDQMTAHSTHVASNWYGQLSDATHSFTPESLDMFRDISCRWHRWLGFASRMDDSVEFDVTMEEIPVSIEEQVHKLTREKYGVTFQWKCQEQKELAIEIARGTTPLVGVLPTGSGKTEAVLMATMLPNAKSTVFVTPLRSLADEIYASCKKRGIDVIRVGKDTIRRARMIIVVTESVQSSSLLKLLDSLHADDCLDRIVVDEVHMLLKDKSYRKHIDSVKEIGLPVQFVYLTATLPPCDEAKLEDEIIFDKPKYIRGLIKKPNVQYAVRTCGTEKERHTMLKSLIDQAHASHGGKALVFCKATKECDNLARFLSCKAYYAGQDTSILQEWNDGPLVASSIIGAGVNLDNIREVYHIGVPYGAMDFEQQVGRGGRNGKNGTVFLILMKQVKPFNPVY